MLVASNTSYTIQLAQIVANSTPIVYFMSLISIQDVSYGGSNAPTIGNVTNQYTNTSFINLWTNSTRLIYLNVFGGNTSLLYTPTYLNLPTLSATNLTLQVFWTLTDGVFWVIATP